MGILDAIEGMTGQPTDGQKSKVLGGLMPAIVEHPGGLAGVMDSLRQNGMDGHVQSWTTGQQQAATPDQVQRGLGGTGLIDRVAEKAGV